jgi:hypothetical protein
LRANVEVRDRRRRLKLYRRCFTGAAAVDWIIEYYRVTRTDAMKVMAKLLYLGAISGEKGPRSSATPEPFHDSHIVYYRFETSREELDRLYGLFRLMTTG